MEEIKDNDESEKNSVRKKSRPSILNNALRKRVNTNVDSQNMCNIF